MALTLIRPTNVAGFRMCGLMWLKRRVPDGADAYPAYNFPIDERLNRDIKL
jgi:hypothetical protein